jgi:hypothetical protein
MFLELDTRFEGSQIASSTIKTLNPVKKFTVKRKSRKFVEYWLKDEENKPYKIEIDSNNELMARRGIQLSEAYYAAPERNHLHATRVWAPFDAVKNARKRRSKKRKISNRPTKNVKHKKETPPKS